MPRMKVVSRDRYAEVLNEHKHEVYHLSMEAWQVPILHGLIALAAEDPDVKNLGWPTKRFIAQIRWWCRQKFSDWGFAPGEVEYLDKVREEVQRDGEKGKSHD